MHFAQYDRRCGIHNRFHARRRLDRYLIDRRDRCRFRLRRFRFFLCGRSGLRCGYVRRWSGRLQRLGRRQRRRLRRLFHGRRRWRSNHCRNRRRWRFHRRRFYFWRFDHGRRRWCSRHRWNGSGHRCRYFCWWCGRWCLFFHCRRGGHFHGRIGWRRFNRHWFFLYRHLFFYRRFFLRLGRFRFYIVGGMQPARRFDIFRQRLAQRFCRSIGYRRGWCFCFRFGTAGVRAFFILFLFSRGFSNCGLGRLFGLYRRRFRRRCTDDRLYGRSRYQRRYRRQRCGRHCLRPVHGVGLCQVECLGERCRRKKQRQREKIQTEARAGHGCLYKKRTMTRCKKNQRFRQQEFAA